MDNDTWFKWCFNAWRGRAYFVMDNMRAPSDVSDRIPPIGWVS